MSSDKNQWLRRYLDGELNDEEERKALQHIAEDAELRALLRFDLQLRRELVSDSFRSVPEGFADRVMQSIEQAEAGDQAPAGQIMDENQSGRDHRTPIVKTIRDRLWQPRQIVWRPVWSAGIAALLVLSVFSMIFTVTFLQQPAPTDPAPARQIVEQTADRVMMRFVYVDSEAESMAVAGDFSDWEPIDLTPQTINGDVAWTGIVPLPRGEHRYMFIKDDDKWTTDPLAGQFIEDGFGNKNAVINL